MTATLFTTTKTLTAASASLNTNTNAAGTQIVSILLHNTNTSTETVQLFFVPNANGAVGASALTNRIASFSLAANETLEFPCKFPLQLANLNDAIFAQTTTANKVVALVSGIKN